VQVGAIDDSSHDFSTDIFEIDVDALAVAAMTS
jgi:hypothetical protein